MAAAWKIMGTGGAIVSGIVARKVLIKGWTAATGQSPPANPESPDTTWLQALLWAGVSGAIVGAARMLWARKAADYYKKSTGHLPPGVEQTS